MIYTVIGHSGFIGRNLVARLRGEGHDVFTPRRDFSDLSGRPLGHVIYAAGVTGSMQTGLFPAVEAHVNALHRAMTASDFTSWVYLSSSRVYGLLGNSDGTGEDAPLRVHAGANDFFALTKLTGESLCLTFNHPRVCVARLSNIYGPDQNSGTFLAAVLASLQSSGKAEIREAAASCKDYLSIHDATRYLAALAADGHAGIYNVGGGATVSHRQIADTLNAQGYDVSFAADGATRAFPALDISKLAALYGQPQHRLLDDLPALVKGAAC